MEHLTRVIKRAYKDDGRLRWFYWRCFCGEQSKYLNHRAMIKGSEHHRALHKEVEVVDESVD